MKGTARQSKHCPLTFVSRTMKPDFILNIDFSVKPPIRRSLRAVFTMTLNVVYHDPKKVVLSGC